MTEVEAYNRNLLTKLQDLYNLFHDHPLKWDDESSVDLETYRTFTRCFDEVDVAFTRFNDYVKANYPTR